jgi:SAM-dependent methyltransferase
MTGRRLPPTASVAEDHGDGRLFAPSAARNAPPIADLLARVAPDKGTALELASGTGQHVVHFAAALPQLHWQPTEIAADRLASIAAYVNAARLPNIKAPIALNATEPGWRARHSADLIVLVNLLHLISSAEAQTLISEAARALVPDGTLVLYGPFMRDGQLISDGDRSFHESLVTADPAIGYKDDRQIADWLSACGLTVAERCEMPSNNLAFVARAR